MDVLIWLVPIALSLGTIWLVAFLWTLRNNQYDDLEGAALRILSDDDLHDGDGPAGRTMDNATTDKSATGKSIKDRAPQNRKS